MSDNINNTNPPSEPLTREEEYLSAIAGVTSSDDIPEKPLTRVEKYLNKIVEDGGGSVYDKLEAGTNINIEETSDGKAKISASGEVSSEDTYAREQISAILDGSTIDSFADVETALTDKVDKVEGKGLSANDFTDVLKTKLDGIAAGAEVNVQSDWNQTTDTADDYIKNKPTLGTAAAKNATDTYSATGDDVTTGKAVAAALATLPEPMVFMGSLGTGGTIATLPTASSSNKGYVYKVITAGTYASQSAKVGDTFISDSSAWVLIPSGDEPSGTVTNVAVANGGGLTVSGSPITSSGTITVGHSNSVTAKTSSTLKKFTYDAYGHVTGSSELSTAESDALASGIDSTKVAQIETNKNNISMIESVALTYVNNSYVDSTAFDRCTAYKVSPNLAIMAVNLQQITEPSSQMADFATIGTLPFYVKQATFASQDKLTLYLTGNTIKIYINGADGTSKYNLRQTIPIVIDLSANQ